MASASIRSLARASFSSLRPPITISKLAPVARSPFLSLTTRTTYRSSALRLPISSRKSTCRTSLRSPAELACCSGSLFPLHAVAAEVNITSGMSLAPRSFWALFQDDFDGS